MHCESRITKNGDASRNGALDRYLAELNWRVRRGKWGSDALLVRNIDDCVGPRRSFLNRGNNLLNSGFHQTPAVLAKHYDSQFPPHQVLLIAEICVSGHEDLKGRVFRGSQEIAIGEGAPILFVGRYHDVARQVAAQSDRSSLIEKNAHQREGEELSRL